MKLFNLAVIGVGSIAEKHLEILSKSNKLKLYCITSKNYKNCKPIFKKYKFDKIYKNYNLMIKDSKIDAFYILVPPTKMYEVLNKIIPLKKVFFCEKPPGLTFKQIQNIEKKLSIFKTPNLLGLNRRYYSIFHKALKEIKKYGHLRGLVIEGNERIWKVENNKNKTIINNWLFANSCHTVDLIRFFGGEISEINVNSSKFKGKKRNFTINFKTKEGVIGTYNSFWQSPGGWSVKLFGDGVSVFFDPLEKGYFLYKNSKKKLIQPSKNDLKYKMGFYNQIKAFEKLLMTNENYWPSQDIQSSVKTFKIIQKIK
jgi:predicted dehydrogenase